MKNIIKKVKGFTLTELAIVIAVIAILIAVLVPTFISLINSANESNDVITVRNMNTVLSTETDDIEKPTDALQIVYEEGGYSVANMTPKSNGKIVYDELTTSFVFVYSDGSTYPEETTTNLTAYTTWELVSTSDITVSSDGAYHFEESSYANNSIILKGSDWAGKTVYAKYGVELWNDNDTTTTLSSLYIENNETAAQTVDAGSVSLAKSAIKTAGSADTTRNLIVNVKTSYLSYSTQFYNISDHSTVNTLLSASGTGTYYQYGTTNGYDITNSGSSNVLVCNEEQAKKINDGEVAIVTTSSVKAADCIKDSTGTVTVNLDNKEEVTIIVVTLEQNDTVQVTITEEGTVTITAGTTEITIDTETSLSEAANSTGLGIEGHPYYIASENDYDIVNKDGYYQLTADIKDTSKTLTVSGVTVVLELDGHYIETSATKAVNVTNSGNLTINDSSSNQTGKIIVESSTSKASYGIYVSNSTLVVNGGTIEGGTYVSGTTNISAGIYVSGTATINGGIISGGAGIRLYLSGAKLVVNGGEISGSTYGIYQANGELTIEEQDDNKIEITSSGTKGAVYVVAGKCTIKSGTISSTNTSGESYGLYLKGGTTYVEGGTISSSDSTSGESVGIYNANYLYVYDGTIIGKDAGINTSHSAEITGGTIKATGNTSAAISANGYKIEVDIGENGDSDGDLLIEGACYGIEIIKATFNIYSGKIKGTYGIVVKGTEGYAGKLNMYGGEIETSDFAICNSGSEDENYATITISGGTITTSTGTAAIYLPAAYGTTTISGGTIKGTTGVEIRGGSLTITGGSFEATAEEFSETYNGGGSTIDGAALAISTYDHNDLTVTVENCSLKGIYAIYECYVNGKYDSSNTLRETALELTYTVSVTVSSITSTGEIYSQNTSIDE